MEQKQEALTQEENKKKISRLEKKAEKEKAGKKKRRKRPRVRLIPIWLRVIIVLLLIVGIFFVGAMIGYGVIGDGEPTEVFQKETWTKIYDIMFEDTEYERDF